MSIKKIALVAGAAAMMTSSVAYASVIDRPFFKVLGVVVVWGADATETADAPIASDFVLLTNTSGSAGNDLITADVYTVLTGTLDPVTDDGAISGDVVDPITGVALTTSNSDGVLNVGDTFGAFDVTNTTDVNGLVNAHNSSFYVASNATFNIFAQATLVENDGDFTTYGLDNISYDLDVVSGAGVADLGGLDIGSASQDPGNTVAMAALDEIAAVAMVFEGDQRTAATRGSLAQQSVEFQATYQLMDDAGNIDYDLSMGTGTLAADVTYTVYVP